MIDFTVHEAKLKDYDAQRELVIKQSRDVLKLSKQLIYALHRSELENATKLLEQIEVERAKLEDLASPNAKLGLEGSFRVALQEYAEAALYYYFVSEGSLKELGIESEHLVAGLADLPGELNRRAVYLAGKGKFEEVVKIRDMVDLIYAKLLQFDFRHNEMRRKVDGIKYELRKLEDLVLDLKLKGKIE